MTDHSSLSHHTKKILRFYLLSALLFCTDDRCSMPLHTLLADIVDSQGGSEHLISILNRLGVCSCYETLKRHIQYRKLKDETEACKTLEPDSFTLVSVDNIDFMLQSM